MQAKRVFFNVWSAEPNEDKYKVTVTTTAEGRFYVCESEGKTLVQATRNCIRSLRSYWGRGIDSDFIVALTYEIAWVAMRASATKILIGGA